MSNKYKIIILILTLLSLLSAFFQIDNAIIVAISGNPVYNYQNNTDIINEDNYYISKFAKISKDDWDDLYTSNCGFSNVYHFLHYVDYYIDKIVSYTETPDWVDLHVKKFRDDYYFNSCINITYNLDENISSIVSNYRELNVSLNKLQFKDNFSTLPADLTKIVMGSSASNSITEGFSLYMQDQIGLNINKYNYGIDIFTYSKEFFNNNRHIVYEIGNCYNTNLCDKAYYILSNSFCSYLIEQYGLSDFLRLYRSENLNNAYKLIYNKDLIQLKIEWEAYLKNYDDYIISSKKYINNSNLIKNVGAVNKNNIISGNKRNTNYYLLNESFRFFLTKQYGIEKYDDLIINKYNYIHVYNKSLIKLKENWIKYINMYK